VTSSSKASVKYGLVGAWTLSCATLAALGSLRAFPVPLGHARGLCLIGVALGMAVQGAAFFPRSWPSRLIVMPQALAAGSLMLFAGAALLLVLLFTGCSRDKAKLAARQTIDFTAANEQFRGARFAIPSLEALNRSCCRDDAKSQSRPRDRSRGPGLGAIGPQAVRLKTVPARARRTDKPLP
jgi:hypothetical protein